MSDLISSNLDFDEKNSWGTDPLIFAALNNEFNFSLDAAASDKNHLLPNFLTEENNALICDWSVNLKQYQDFYCGYKQLSKNVWVNPPYGKGYIKKFMQKAIKEKAKGVTTVMLVPATLDAQWLPLNDISEIRIVTGGRLSFIHPVTGKKISGNTKGSMFVIFKPTTSPLVTRYVNRDELLALGESLMKIKEAA